MAAFKEQLGCTRPPDATGAGKGAGDVSREVHDALAGDMSRYARQALLPGFGVEAQRVLARSRAVIVGCGALGTVASESLVRAGVGRVRVVDRDVVEETNLQRQTLFTQQDADDGNPKAVAAAERLGRINPRVCVEPIVADATPGNVERLLEGAEVVLDCTDNFQTRYLLNDVCVKLGLPLVYGGAVGTRGMAMTILPREEVGAEGDADGGGGCGTGAHFKAGVDRVLEFRRGVAATPCLRCVFPVVPAVGGSPTCDTAGVLGPVPGIVGNVQAVEAMKVLLERWELVSRTLLEFDPWCNEHRRVDLRGSIDAECSCCGHRRFELLDDASAEFAQLCGQDAVQIPGDPERRVDLDAVADRFAAAMTGGGGVRRSRYLVRANLPTARGERELTLFADGRAIVKGTADAAEARSLYARFVGS